MRRRILMLHYGDNGLRGSEVVFIQSVKSLKEAGYDVAVCRNFGVIDSYIQDHVGAHSIFDLVYPEIMIDGLRGTALPLLSYARANGVLRRIAKSFRPDLIFCSSGLPCQLAVPVGRLAGIPVLCHFHHPAVRRAYYLWLTFLADHVVFPSRFTKSHSERKGGLAGEVIYLGVDVERFRPADKRELSLRAMLGISNDATVIGQVAQLVEHKRPDFLMRAFALIRERQKEPLHLCLVGRGPMEESLRSLARHLRVEQYVSITGGVADVLPYYQHVFDVNALVSREEGLGLSAIEGSACELPALVTNCTGLSETVLDGQTGLTFAENDLDDLCKKLSILVGSASLRERMGKEGRSFVCRVFSAATYGKQLAQAIEETISTAETRRT